MKLHRQLMAYGLLMMLAGTGKAAESTEPGVGDVYGNILNQCRTELSLLKTMMDTSLYQREEQILNDNLASASQYLLMRDRLTAEMQATLDRLHQANLTRSCQQIHNVLFNQLISKSAVIVGRGGEK